MSRAKNVSRYVLAIFMVGAGVMHFVNPAFYLKIMPSYLPLHRELVLISGICEVLLGMLRVVPQCTCLAAWGIIALLIAVFPANLHVYQHQELIPASSLSHMMRLPLQALLILWVWWHTKSTDMPLETNRT